MLKAFKTFKAVTQVNNSRQHFQTKDISSYRVAASFETGVAKERQLLQLATKKIPVFILPTDAIKAKV